MPRQDWWQDFYMQARAVPVMPLYFAAGGFLTGLVGAWLYNWLLARKAWTAGLTRFFLPGQ